jgi:hypothetical protein
MTFHLNEHVRGLYQTRRYWTGTIIQILPEDKYRVQWTANGTGRPVKCTIGICSGINLQAITINRDRKISTVICIILAAINGITLWSLSDTLKDLFFGLAVEKQLINDSGSFFIFTTMEDSQLYFGLLNDISLNTNTSHENVSHYTRNLNMTDAVDFLRNSRNYLFERAQMDAVEQGRLVDDYLKNIREHTSKFIQRRELYGREELMDRLTKIISGRGNFVCVAGGSGAGVSLAFNNLHRKFPSSTLLLHLSIIISRDILDSALWELTTKDGVENQYEGDYFGVPVNVSSVQADRSISRQRALKNSLILLADSGITTVITDWANLVFSPDARSRSSAREIHRELRILMNATMRRTNPVIFNILGVNRYSYFFSSS